MKISCDIIRDLLPLYAENMTSQASNDMVDQHLQACQGCKGYLDALRLPAKIPMEVSAQSLKHVKKDLSKRRFLTALMAVFVVLSLITGIRAFLNADIYLTARQAVDHVEEMEDGTVKVYWRYLSDGYLTWKDNGFLEPEPGNCGILTTKTRGELLSGKSLVTPVDMARSPASAYTIFGEPDKMYHESDNYWYINFRNGTGELLLRDGGAEMPYEGYQFQPANYRLLNLWGWTAILTVVLVLAAWLLRRSWAGKLMRFAALFFGSACVSILFASGGQFVSFGGSNHNKLTDALLPFLLLLVTGYFSFELWDMSHPKAPRERSPEKEKTATVNKRRFFTALTVIFLLISILTSIYSFLYVATVYMTAEEAQIFTKELENGDVEFHYYNNAGRLGTKNEEAEGMLHIAFMKQVLPYRLHLTDQPRKQEEVGWYTMTKEELESEPSQWYLNPKDGTADVLLWDNGTPKPEGPMVTKSYTLGWYCLGTAVCTAILFILAHFLPIIARYLRYGALVSGSLCLAALVISGGEFYKFMEPGVSFLFYRIRNSLPTAFPIFLTGLSALKLHDLKKQDTP